MLDALGSTCNYRPSGYERNRYLTEFAPEIQTGFRAFEDTDLESRRGLKETSRLGWMAQGALPMQFFCVVVFQSGPGEIFVGVVVT